ncbi:MAG: hypothetical protein AB8F26_13230 [Phycisphaerales bacterium]
MIRPKKQRKSKHVQLWTHPLSRAADLESRQIEERIWAESRPFVMTWALKMPAAILLMGTAFQAEQARMGINVIPSAESAEQIALLLGNLALWIVPPLMMVELIMRARRSKRWVTNASPRLRSANNKARAAFAIIAALAFTPIAWVFVTLVKDQAITVLLACLLAAIYLITTGIHRRTGWDRRCAKCAYPHPDPKPYPVTCPECGRTLRPDSYKDIILGKNVRSIPRIVIGLVLLAALIAAATVL